MLKKLFLTMIMVALMISGALAGEKTLVLTWEHDLPQDLAGFELYYSQEPIMINCEGDPNATLVDLPWTPDQTELTSDIPIESPDGGRVQWFFRMNAYDTSGNVSECSNETFAWIDFDKPNAPTQLKAIIKVVNP